MKTVGKPGQPRNFQQYSNCSIRHGQTGRWSQHAFWSIDSFPLRNSYTSSGLAAQLVVHKALENIDMVFFVTVEVFTVNKHRCVFAQGTDYYFLCTIHQVILTQTKNQPSIYGNSFVNCIVIVRVVGVVYLFNRTRTIHF